MFEKFQKFKSILSELLEIATPEELQKINAMDATMKYCMEPMVYKPDLAESAETGMYQMLTRLEKRLASRSNPTSESSTD